MDEKQLNQSGNVTENPFKPQQDYTSLTQDAICPNCGCTLSKFPGRSIWCRVCGERIFRIKIPNTEQIYLLNSSEGLLLKNEIETYYLNKYKQKEAEQIGISLQDYEKIERKDISELVSKLLNEKRYNSVAFVYRDLVFRYYDERKYQKAYECQKQFIRYSLEDKLIEMSQMFSYDELEVEIWTKDYCKIQHKTHIPIDLFKKELPIPCCAKCPSAPIFDCIFCITLKNN